MGNDGDLRSVGGGKYVPVTDNLDNRDNHDEFSPLSEDDRQHRSATMCDPTRTSRLQERLFRLPKLP